MQLENQVCTLDQSKRLHELSIKAESIFYWVGETENDMEVEYASGYNWSDYPCYAAYPVRYPAYTVGELGEMLLSYSEFITNPDNRHIWRVKFEHKTTTSPERNYGTGTTVYSENFKTEAQARAAMLIYLLENNLLTP